MGATVVKLGHSAGGTLLPGVIEPAAALNHGDDVVAESTFSQDTKVAGSRAAALRIPLQKPFQSAKAPTIPPNT